MRNLSIIASVMILGTSVFASSNTLEEAFKHSEITGELKAYYFANKNDQGDKDSILTSGVSIGFKTDSLYGFSLGITAQGSSSPFADNGAKEDYNSHMYGPGAVLSEAYLAYNVGKTTLQIGRQFIDTPLISGSGSRVIKESFEGITLVNTDIPDTTITAGYVQKFQARTADGDYDAPKFTKTFKTGSSIALDLDNGAYTTSIVNKSIHGLTLTGAYAYADAFILDANTALTLVDGGVHLVYVEALYEGNNGEIGYTLGVQDYFNHFETIGIGLDNNINTYALKAGLSFKGINGTVAFSQTSNDHVAGGAIISGLGNGADLLYTDAIVAAPGYTPDTKTYMFDINYDVTEAANIGARYTYADDKFDDLKQAYTSIYAYYKFVSSLQGLKMGIEFEDKSKDVDGNDLWFKANYKF